mmetsp:Transcript_40038/g.86686  ORF Transcript_40038/g.86686 Transcript_40038/m.86686 type:complete len:215 (+) Transcript_40038:2359-3003(+)
MQVLILWICWIFGLINEPANGAEVLQVTGAARLSRDRQLNAAHPAELIAIGQLWISDEIEILGTGHENLISILHRIWKLQEDVHIVDLGVAIEHVVGIHHLEDVEHVVDVITHKLCFIQRSVWLGRKPLEGIHSPCSCQRSRWWVEDPHDQGVREGATNRFVSSHVQQLLHSVFDLAHVVRAFKDFGAIADEELDLTGLHVVVLVLDFILDWHC